MSNTTYSREVNYHLIVVPATQTRLQHRRGALQSTRYSKFKTFLPHHCHSAGCCCFISVSSLRRSALFPMCNPPLLPTRKVYGLQ